MMDVEDFLGEDPFTKLPLEFDAFSKVIIKELCVLRASHEFILNNPKLLYLSSQSEQAKQAFLNAKKEFVGKRAGELWSGIVNEVRARG